MPERTSYANGTPCWTDLGTPDIESSVRFYTELMGWEASEPGPPESGGYLTFHVKGRTVAGIGPLMSEGQPPAWTTYLATDDADAAAQAIARAGGHVLTGPMQVMQEGRLVIFTDLVGAVTGLWEAGNTHGAELVSEAGTLVWNQLNTHDAEAAQRFYGEVFGWEGRPSAADADDYVTLFLGDSMIGGMLEMRELFPPATPSHWLSYFGVQDADAAVGRVVELGGAVAAKPMDIPAGRFAVVTDPHGAAFAVIAMAATG